MQSASQRQPPASHSEQCVRSFWGHNVANSKKLLDDYTLCLRKVPTFKLSGAM